MTQSDARRIALDYLKAQEPQRGFEVVLLDRYTIERDFGWVCFYDSKRHQESGSIRDAIAGNAPIVVTKADGRIHVTGTGRPIEYYLQRFENYGDGRAGGNGEE